MRDYFQEALHTFNGGNWYGWKKFDDSDGNKIPNEHTNDLCECIRLLKMVQLCQQKQK
jgi:hypothetical protein